MFNSINKNEDLEVIVPKPCLEYSGYFYYPDNKILICSKDGDVINTRTGNILKPYLHKCGRYNIVFSIPLGDNKYKHTNIKLHRILAKTFIGRPSRHLTKKYSDLQVNHIDGNPANNKLNNLEWCVCKENILHSNRNGLHPTCVKVLARHLQTKEIIKFNSVSHCAEHFKLHKATLWKHLSKGNSGKAKCNNYIFKLDDNTMWNFYYDDVLSEIGMGNDKIAISVINIKTGFCFITDNLKEAAKLAKVSYINLYRKLNKTDSWENGFHKFVKI